GDADDGDVDAAATGPADRQQPAQADRPARGGGGGDPGARDDDDFCQRYGHPGRWRQPAVEDVKREEGTMSGQQRTAIVTGAAGGIGRELVLGLLGKGLKVAAVDRTAQGLAGPAQTAQEPQRGAHLETIEAAPPRAAATAPN